MKLELRRMTPELAASAYRLELECFSTPWSEAAIEEELCNPLAVYWGAFDGEELVGYAGMQHILDEGHITNVAVAEKMRRRGVGRLLVEALLRYAEANALAFVTLEVRASNAAAIALYASFGFAECGRRKDYYRGPAEDALIMTRQRDAGLKRGGLKPQTDAPPECAAKGYLFVPANRLDS